MVERTILIVAGEASGDTYGAQVVRCLKERDPELSFFGIGGRELEAEGVEILWPCHSLAVVGLMEVLGKLPLVYKAWRAIMDRMRTSRPHLAILIDFPGFNLRLARKLKEMGIPVLYYVAPQVWAWWPQRATALARVVDKLAVILPFEGDFFKGYGIEATFVGHPQREVLKKAPSKDEARALLGLREGEMAIGVFPGSRKGEMERHFGPMVAACRILKGRYPHLRFFLALVPGLGLPGDPDPLEPFEGGALEVLAASDLMIAASGTVTLQGALMGVPMVVVYKVNPLSFSLGKRLVKVPYIALPNLLLGYPVVPELLQGEATPERIAREVTAIIEDEEKQKRMREGFRMILELLPEGAPARVAEMALQMIREQGT